jgi:hypothetical protein
VDDVWSRREPMTALGREEPIASAGKSHSPAIWPSAVEWLHFNVQRSADSQDCEWQVPAAAVIGSRNLAGRNQS